MTVSAPSHLSIAIDHAKKGRRVALCCPPDQTGACQCGGTWDDKLHQLVPHTQKEVGKAPIGRFFPKGINDATTNTAKLDGFLRKMPDANVSVDLASTNWLVVDTDSEETEAAELAHGLDGAVIRESRHRAYVFERPADCPAVNLIKKDGDALDILTVGNFLVGGVHATGARIWMDPNAKPGPAPARYVEMLKAKAAADAANVAALDARRVEWATQYGAGQEPPVRLHQRGLRRWRGELVEAPNGELDRDLSLWYIGLDLADCGATPGAIVEALKERDLFLGWEKFTNRKDDREYVKIAEKAVASAIEKEQAPRIQLTAADAGIGTRSTPADKIPPDPGEPATYDDAMAEIKRLRRLFLDRDDLLDDQKAIINAERAEKEAAVETIRRIGDVLAVPKERLAPAPKILTIVALLEAHSRASRGVSKLPSAVLEERSGMSKNMVSTWIQDLAARQGSPIKRRLTREWRTNENGIQEPITVSEIIPTHATVGESLAAVLEMGPPSNKAERQRETARERAEKQREWGRCSSHDNDLVAVKGYCPDCGEVVGERVMRVEEFDVLNPLIHELRESSPGPQHAVSIRAKGQEKRESASTSALDHEVRESEPQPLNLLDYAVEWPKPWRCHCGSMERYSRAEGGHRCDGCGDVTLPTSSKSFVPAATWQEIPDGFVCPPGGEFRMDFQTGKNWGRWREPAQAVAGGEE